MSQPLYEWADADGGRWRIVGVSDPVAAPGSVPASCRFVVEEQSGAGWRMPTIEQFGFPAAEELLRLAPLAPLLAEDWKPTAESVEALPPAVRDYVRWLEDTIAEAQAVVNAALGEESEPDDELLADTVRRLIARTLTAELERPEREGS